MFTSSTPTGARLTSDPSVDASPTWSRNGKWIYFCSSRTGDLQYRGMHLTPETPTYSMRGCGGLPADAGGV